MNLMPKQPSQSGSEYIAISDMFLNNEDAKFVQAMLDKVVAICQKRAGTTQNYTIEHYLILDNTCTSPWSLSEIPMHNFA